MCRLQKREYYTKIGIILPRERNDPIIFAFISHTEMADTILGGSPDLNSSRLFPSQIENNPMDMNKHSLIQ